jgi:ABC-2 type transport system ATP-binding protein
MLSVIELKKSYEKVQALNSVSLSVKKGEMLGLIGPNGAGKSTLLRCIIGMLYPDSGTITIGELSTENDIQQIKSIVGYAAEEPTLYPYLTGREYLEFISQVRGIDEPLANNWINGFFNEFGLTTKADELISDYSHGMRQKISLAAAMIFNPQLLLLDEPTNALDPESIFHFKQRLNRMRDNGTTIVFSSHILDTVEKICDRVAVINKGQIIVCDTVANLINSQKDKSLEDIFMTLVTNE